MNPHSKKINLLSKRFLSIFPLGFIDEKYIAWERGYKWNAHLLWKKYLGKNEFSRLLSNKEFKLIAKLAVNIESKTNLLFSFEKMALRDSVKSEAGAKIFSLALYEFIYGKGSKKSKFENFVKCLRKLPRKKTRVVTWPLITVFGFIAKPQQFIFLKSTITKLAAKEYEYDFQYNSYPTWETYSSLMSFAKLIKTDLAKLHPKDYIDIQSFIWTLGSDEYR
jgi:hypothetical protein